MTQDWFGASSTLGSWALPVLSTSPAVLLCQAEWPLQQRNREEGPKLRAAPGPRPWTQALRRRGGQQRQGTGPKRGAASGPRCRLGSLNGMRSVRKEKLSTWVLRGLQESGVACGVSQCGQPNLPETDFQSKRPCRHQERTRIDQYTSKGHTDVLIFNLHAFHDFIIHMSPSDKVLDCLSHADSGHQRAASAQGQGRGSRDLGSNL